MTTTIVQNSFLPTQIPGCKLWVDGADPAGTGIAPANASTVSTWKDKSGLANNATSAGSAVTYSSAGLYFGGSSYYNVPGIAGTLANTPFVIFIVETNQSNGFFFGDDGSPGVTNNTLHIGYRNVNQLTFAFWANDIEDTNVSGIGNTRIWGFYLPSGANRNIRRNGATDVTGPNSTALSSFNTPVIGRIVGANYYTGTISEIIVYNKDIGLGAIQQVEGYLAWKWGLVANLPPTHPYKNTPAVIITQPSTLALLTVTNLLNNGLFLPPTIPGCQIWLDGADPAGTGIAPINGASISTWADKSGNAKSATATSGNATFSAAALNGRGVLAFGGAAYLTSQLTMATTTPLTYFAVARPNVTTNFYAVSAINGGPTNVRPNTLMLYKAYNDYWWFSGGTGAVDGNTVTLLSSTSRYDINANYWSPSYTQMNINGTSYASSTAAPTSLANGGTFLVGIASGLYEYWNGWIAELIIYNSALTTNQRQQIEGYLAWKWGLQANLPPTHPYKAAPFSPFSAVASVASLLNTNQLNSKLITSMFNPKNITGCQIWFDGADPLGTGSAPSNATTISTWADKSGNARNATATGTPTYSAKILNGIGAPLLSGSTSYFTTPSFIPSPTGIPSIFIVMRQTSYVSGNSDFFLASDYRVIDLLGQGNNYNAALTIGNSAQTPLTAINATLNPTLLSVIVTSGVGGVGYANGTYAATTGSSGGSLASSYVYYIGGGPGFIGYIYEVMMYNSSLSTAQRQQVEGYLAWKWGLQANLPSTHPYKILPPSPN